MSNAWYGKLPERWNINRIGTLFSENITSNEDLVSEIPMQFKYGSIIRKKIAFKDDNFLESLRRYVLIQPNDIMINGLNLNYDFVSQRVAIVREEGCMTPAYISMRPNARINPMFACYMFKAMDGQKLLHGLGTGIRLTLGFSELKKTYLPLPPRDEQDQIVRYLDWKVSAINKLINAKRRQIELLGEYKKSAINEAVTSKNWNARRLKTFITETNETVGIKFADYDLLSLTKNGVVIRDTSSGKGKFPNDFGAYKIVCPGQIIFCLFDVDETPRTVGLSNNSGMITGAYDVFSISGIDAKFLEYYFLAIDDVKGLKPLYTGLRKVVSKDRFLQLRIPLPSIQEQQELVAYLDEQCNNIDKIIATLNDEITLLTEYRTRLISDVVTGKLDVRDVVVPEYEAVEDIADTEDTDTEEAEDMQ